MSADRPLTPNTTAEQDLHSASQRQVNKVWEYTQSVIAIAVTTTTLGVCVALVVKGGVEAAVQLLSNAFFLIIGFYFGRTNHTNVGGVRSPYDTR